MAYNTLRVSRQVIGMGMDEDAVSAQLDACLLSGSSLNPKPKPPNRNQNLEPTSKAQIKGLGRGAAVTDE